jgi:hypothetical protein
MTSTAAMAQPIFALLMGFPFVPVDGATTDPRRARLPFEDSACVNQTTKTVAAAPIDTVLRSSAIPSTAYVLFDAYTRKTTPKEHTIGELRRWKMLSAGWDGAQAQTPKPESLQDAVTFVRFLKDTAGAEPMLHATGRAGLFWREADLYADLEFLGCGRIAYFIERNGDKHKGVVNFDAKEMPAVLEAILPT